MKNETTIRISALDNTRKAFDSVKSNLSDLKQRVFSVQGAIAGIVGGTVGASFLQANRSFQSLQASLITFTGSAEEATRQFKILSDFATRTPFELEEIVSGFNKLVARGMNPTIEAFESFGNIAAGTGKTLDQFIEAVADAVTGEFERLKEFGIKASKEGDKVKFTFGGMTTEIGNNATAIQGFLTDLGETKFAGAMARQADTLNGAISNLKDSFFSLATGIGESGVNKAIVTITRSMSDFVNLLAGAFKPENEKQLNKLNLGIEELSRALDKIDAKGTKGLGEVLDRKRIQGQLDVLREQVKELKKYDVALNTVQQTQKKAAKPEQTKKKLFPEIIDFMDVAKAKIRELDEAFALEEPPKLISFFEVINEKVKQFDYENIDKGKTALEEYALAAQNVGLSLDNYAADAIKGLEDTLTGLIMGTVKTKDAFKSMAASIIADLTRIVIQRSITGPLAELLFSALPGFGGGSGAPAPVSTATFTPTGRAIGGPVQSGSPYMVGERGAELFVPNTSGTIVPSNKLGSGGVTINQTLNIDASADRAAIQRALELNRRQTISEINDLMRRNSPALARM